MCYHNCSKTILNKPKLIVYQIQYSFKIWKIICKNPYQKIEIETLVKKENRYFKKL